MKTNKNILYIILIIVFLGWDNNYTSSQNTINKETQEIIVGIEIGNKAPDLKFASPDGKELSLSSLKGRIVLLDFWASWCGPCRRENPNIVLAYQKYKSAKFKNAKGFEIYSVSLDKSKTAWEKAIEVDNLGWKYHVSDLKSWGSEAANIYKVHSIPMNFIIDAKGIIIAKNLRGQQLHQQLDKLVERFKK